MNEGAPGLDFQTWASAASATVLLRRSTANGNLLAHSDSVMGDWGFGYDTLNRLTGAAAGNAPTADGAPATWVNSIGCWNYDSFGNRTVAAITTTGDCSSLGAATASYTASNKVSFVSQAAPISYSAPSGFTYDAGGNVLADGQNTYLYDGEGRLCAVKSLGGEMTAYLYDAEGLRVAKGTITTLSCNLASNGFSLTNQYLLDQSGDQVTELDGSGNWKHSNVWAGAHLDATYDQPTSGVPAIHFH